MAIKPKINPSPRPSSATGTPDTSPLWEDAGPEITRRVAMVLVVGDTGTGRTTWALSAPAPIALIHSAEKIDGIYQPVYKKLGPHGTGKGGIHNFGGTFAGKRDTVSKHAMQKWRTFQSVWYDAFTWARTVIVDTDTDLWALVRLAYFGGLKPDGGRIDANYGPVNADFMNTLKYFRNQGRTNVILISQTQDEYIKPKKTSKNDKDKMGERTGRTIRSGMKHIPFAVDIIVRTDKGDGVFSSTIEKGWYNAAAEGVPMEGEESSFPKAMEMISGLDAEEWE